MQNSVNYISVWRHCHTEMSLDGRAYVFCFAMGSKGRFHLWMESEACSKKEKEEKRLPTSIPLIIIIIIIFACESFHIRDRCTMANMSYKSSQHHGEHVILMT